VSTFIKFLFIFYFFFISFSYSETLKTSDLFVTATRSNQESDNLLSDISIIHYDEINKSGSTSIVDLLQRQPGIEISNSGGLGKQSSVYMRGANANQLIVLVDGVRMNSITTGLTAFENLPLSQIEKIEILRGPSASLYGSDGIGGVIQIFTKKNKSGYNPYANFGYSRYATKTNTIGFTAGGEKLRYGFHLNSIDSNGFSSLQTNEAIIKDDDGFNSLNINGNIEYDFDKDNSVKLSLLSNQGHNEYDNRYRSYYGNTVPNVKNKMLNQNINLLFKNKFSHNWDSQLLLSSSLDKYTDQQIINANYDGLERSNLYYQTIQNEFNWTNNIQSSLGSFTIAIDRLEQKLSSNNAYDENRRNNTGYVFNYFKDFGPHIIHGSYRVDLNTHSGTNNTKSIGYGFKFNHNWKASLQYGEAFKNPTFNDLYAAYDQYYTPNPNLQSETSKNIEANINFVDESNNLRSLYLKTVLMI
jgi:vitamin B12 transporter